MRSTTLTLALTVLLPASIIADDSAWTDLGSALPGSQGKPQLGATGALVPSNQVFLSLKRAHKLSTAILVLGNQNASVPFGGGTMVPSPDVISAPIPTGAAGAIEFSAVFPPAFAPGIDLYAQFWVADPTNASGLAASNAIKGTTANSPEGGSFPATWINGTSCGSNPTIQVHAYNDDFYILRQSLCNHFEAPFIYLLFGDTKVLMMDTGAGSIGNTLANTVYGVINDWLVQNGQASIQLVVSHLHAHSDHVAGDAAFQGKPNTVVVGTSQTAVKNFFGIGTWPTQIVPFDLGGGRVVDVVPIPGHHSAHVAFYDRRTAILFTGDSLYPGRLYVFGATSQGNWPLYQASTQRLVDFTSTRDLCWILGTHIEMSNVPGVDFPIGSTVHLNERVLQLERTHLIELNDAVQAMGSNPHIENHGAFIIYPSG